MNTTDFDFIIDGRRHATAAQLPVINPATGAAFAQAPLCTPKQLELAISTAQQLDSGWLKDIEQRRTALRQCAELIEAQVEPLATVLTSEQGKPIEHARNEVLSAAHWFRKVAKLNYSDTVLTADNGRQFIVKRRPFGVVAAITPWNMPIGLASWKLAPAILAGNGVVLKPSPFAPLSPLLLGELLQQALPPGVLNVINGDDEIAKALTNHPSVRKISFTGSIATGKAIAHSTADDLKRLTLELGGNDAAIVLDDADPEVIAEKLFWGAFTNAGQLCIAIKRLYLAKSLYSRLVDALAALANEVVVGDGLNPKTQMGPVTTKPQLHHLRALADECKHDGATLIGAGYSGPGYCFRPTLVTNVRPNARIVTDEQFGPLLPILPFDAEAEAIAMANSTQFGLGGSVWTKDLERGFALCEQMQTGMCWVNQHFAIIPEMPFGGAKWSGIGHENGQWGLDAFSQLQAVHGIAL